MLVLVTALFLFLLLSGLPVFVTLGIPALLYAVIKALPASMMTYSIFQSLNSFPLVAAPLFILMGSLVNEYGETERIYNFARHLLRNRPGYSAKVNVLVSLIFSGISGSAVADIGGLGQIEVRAMETEGFSRPYSSALTAATSIVGPIFPPSIPLIIYSASAQVSTLDALLAGIIPALVIILVLFIFVVLQTRSKLISTPAKPNNIEKPSLSQGDDSLFQTFKKAFPIMFLAPLIIASMLFGIFSPSEAGAFAVIYVILLEIFRGEFKITRLIKCITATYKMTTGILVIIALAAFFTKVLTLEHFPQLVTSWFLNISSNKIVILLLINAMVLVVGMFMETIAALIILTPILLTITESIGVHPLHLGIMLVFNLTIGLYTPPFGVGVYTVANVVNVAPDKVFKELLSLYVPLLAALLIITFLPQLSLCFASG